MKHRIGNLIWDETPEEIEEREKAEEQIRREQEEEERRRPPTWQETVEAQIAYTALMTDTLLEE